MFTYVLKNQLGTQFQLSHLYKFCDLTALNLISKCKQYLPHKVGRITQYKGPIQGSAQCRARHIQLVRSISTGTVVRVLLLLIKMVMQGKL